MSHYETLGVPKDASSSDIRHAYRKLAREHHPDHHDNDGESMAAVNAAYACLSDPERRAAYDRTGRDGAGTPIEDEAMQCAMSAVGAALDASETPAREANKMLRARKSQITEQMRVAKDQAKTLRRKRDRIKSTAERNLFHMAIDSRITLIETTIESGKRALKVIDLAVNLLDGHTDDLQTAPLHAAMEEALHPIFRTSPIDFK